MEPSRVAASPWPLLAPWPFLFSYILLFIELNFLRLIESWSLHDMTLEYRRNSKKEARNL